jgi:hypothetical protein
MLHSKSEYLIQEQCTLALNHQRRDPKGVYIPQNFPNNNFSNSHSPQGWNNLQDTEACFE